jgi:hypothetical protein
VSHAAGQLHSDLHWSVISILLRTSVGDPPGFQDVLLCLSTLSSNSENAQVAIIIILHTHSQIIVQMHNSGRKPNTPALLPCVKKTE